MNMMNIFPIAARRTLFAVALPLTLSGCVNTPASPNAAPSHPANTHADASPVPPLQPGLLAITNMLMVKPVTTPAPEHQHGHEQHGAKPEEKK